MDVSSTIYNKLILKPKTKTTLILRVLIISLCCIFFPLEAIIDSRLEDIELNSYLFNKNQLFIKKKSFQIFVDIISKIIGNSDSIMVYISLIYLIVHPFIGLKLILITTIFQYIIIIMQIIYQAHRPFWDSEEIDTICKNTYPNPSLTIFHCYFFYLYIFISFNMFKKRKFTLKLKLIILCFYLIYIASLYFMFITTFFFYHHQIVYNIILSIVAIVFLIDYDTKIYNFIFKSLKNLYNTRVYKMKIFYFVTGLFILGYLGLFFIEENNKNEIINNIQKNKDCTEYDIDTFGLKEAILNTSFLVGLIGAFWGASFTVEKKVGNWWNWNKKSNKIIIIKILCTLFICGVFIIIKYFLKELKNKFELYFMLKTLSCFFESYTIFGLMPLFFGYMKYNDDYELQSYEKINLKLINDDDIQLFRNTIFNLEKKDKEKDAFIVVDKEDKNKENEIKEENKIINEDDNIINNSAMTELNKEDLSIKKNEENDNNKKINETRSMILNNLIEIKEEEGDYEFDIDNDKENKDDENIMKLKEDLIKENDEDNDDEE